LEKIKLGNIAVHETLFKPVFFRSGSGKQWKQIFYLREYCGVHEGSVGNKR
jgi:hypothetical protein